MTDDIWPEPQPEPAPIEQTTRDRFREVLRLEGIAAAASQAAATVRAQLDEEARAEYLRTGAAPTWRIADIGTVTLPVTKEAVVVADAQQLLAWCQQRAPEQIRTVPEVYPAFQAWLLANCLVVDDRAVHPDTGEVVPGLAVRHAGQPRTLSFRPDPDARAVFAEHGQQWLAQILGGAR